LAIIVLAAVGSVAFDLGQATPATRSSGHQGVLHRAQPRVNTTDSPGPLVARIVRTGNAQLAANGGRWWPSPAVTVV